LQQPYALVVDDHPLVASGIANFLITHCQFKHAAVATSGQQGVQHILKHGAPELLVIDFWLPDGAALKMVKEIKQHYAQIKILVVSGDDNSEIWQKVRAAGGNGFVHKNAAPEHFAAAINALSGQHSWFPQQEVAAVGARADYLFTFCLTPRQIEVLNMMMRGFPNKRIALELAISEATVKEHISNILKKLGVESRVEAITLLHDRRERF
jgi:DNA-binding NarL/FixJ family response regulator